MTFRFNAYFHIETREMLWKAWTERVADGTRSFRVCAGPFYFGASIR